MPVRQYHRRDESKILPHVRRGLQLDNLSITLIDISLCLTGFSLIMNYNWISIILMILFTILLMFQIK